MNHLYPYADGPLLEERNTYFYSEFGGEAFLRAWAETRDWSTAATPVPPPAALSRKLPEPDTPVDTAALLDGLYAAVANSQATAPACRHWLDLLVKKFEVTKRVHARYDGQFRTTSPGQHSDFGLYLRAAEVFDAAYAATGRLPFLNALLKILDTLNAYRAELDDALTGRLAWLCVREREHVRTLAARNGVAL